MKFSWIALVITILVAVLFPASVSYKEGTFSRKRGKKMHMAFLHNWAISFGDSMLFPVINALTILWVLEHRWYTYAACLCIGFVITWAEHRTWWGHDENLGHVFSHWSDHRFIAPYHNWKNRWKEDMTMAGWIHFIYMVLQVTIMVLFLITPIDPQTVLAVIYLFSLFLIVQNAQAFYIQGSFDPWVAKFEAVGVALILAIKLTPKWF